MEAIIEAARDLAARQLEQEAQGEAVEVSAATVDRGGPLASSEPSLLSSTGARVADAGRSRRLASDHFGGTVGRCTVSEDPAGALDPPKHGPSALHGSPTFN